MQFSLFTKRDELTAVSYRCKFGLSLPPEGSIVEIKHSPGLKWYMVWLECKDLENILFGWEGKKQTLIKIANELNYRII